MSNATPFKGKFLHVWSKDPVKNCLLENPRIEQLGDRSFVVGELARGPVTHARTGLTYWFPIDDVLSLSEYPDAERARLAVDENKQRKQAKGET